jgi:hypothetical protein
MYRTHVSSERKKMCFAHYDRKGNVNRTHTIKQWKFVSHTNTTTLKIQIIQGKCVPYNSTESYNDTKKSKKKCVSDKGKAKQLEG